MTDYNVGLIDPEQYYILFSMLENASLKAPEIPTITVAILKGSRIALRKIKFKHHGLSQRQILEKSSAIPYEIVEINASHRRANFFFKPIDPWRENWQRVLKKRRLISIVLEEEKKKKGASRSSTSSWYAPAIGSLTSLQWARWGRGAGEVFFFSKRARFLSHPLV